MHLTRRAALLSAGAGLLAACTSKPRPRTAPAVDPDTALAAAAVARELALLAAYDEALATSPALAPRLAALRAEHVEHLRALGQVPASPGASGTPQASPTPASPTPASHASASPPAGRAAVLLRLRALERAGADGHAGAALAASRRLAPVLASLAASEASHAAVL